MKISLIHPSRQRVMQAFGATTAWLSKAKAIENIEYILSLDSSDPDLPEYLQKYSILPQVRIYVNDNKTAIEAINNAANLATGDLFVVMSDDFDCPENWDLSLSSLLEDKKDFIVKTLDGTQEWIITLPIMDRVYYNRFGYIYYPEYSHMFCDTEMSHVADLLGRVIKLPLLFKHNHYSVGASKKDAINTKNDNTWGQGENLYLKRVSENFKLIGELHELKCHPGHLAWLKQRGIKLN